MQVETRIVFKSMVYGRFIFIYLFIFLVSNICRVYLNSISKTIKILKKNNAYKIYIMVLFSMIYLCIHSGTLEVAIDNDCKQLKRNGNKIFHGTIVKK